MYIYIKVAIVLKRHNQAKIIKKSVFLFRLLDMSIICEHVHGLELLVAHILYQLSKKQGLNLISDMHVQNKKYGNN